MSDLLLDELPTRWYGREINSDFRPMVSLANAYARGIPEKEPLSFADDACQRFYRGGISGVQNLQDAYRHLLEFYLGGEEATPGKGSGSASHTEGLPFDYHCDAPYIVAAFQQAYGIDLTREKVHWWRFKALLRGLPEDCLFHHILQWRTADLSRMTPEDRGVYEEKREIFALPPEVKGGAAHAVSVAEHDAAFLARFQQR